MAMSPRLLRPRASSALVATDADARAYINAVRTADGGQYMEAAVQRAIDAFITGCKADGIWTAIKSSCILMGARTLSGALTPLVGAAPTNNNFVSGDYNRKTGLVGNGSTKYLNSNRNNNADPQNSKHMAFYSSTAGTAGIPIGCGAGSDTGRSVWVRFSADPASNPTRLNCATATNVGNSTETGFLGLSRSAAGSYSARLSGSSQTVSQNSETPQNENIGVFARSTGASFNNDRIAYYSIGESLNLALLDSRVTTLYNAIGAAIP